MKWKILSDDVIKAAIDGEIEATEKVVRHYSGYIRKICSNAYFDENGNRYGVDEEMQSRIESKLIEKISCFKF